MRPERTATSFRRLPFNMIEVVLALAVVAIGMLSILGLIPIGTKATRDAIGSSYAADRADFLLHYIAAKATTTGGWGIITGLPTTNKPDTDSPAGPIEDWTLVQDDLYSTASYPDNNGPTIYRLHRTRISKGEEKVDFDAVVTIWTTQTSSASFNGTNWVNGGPAALSERAQLNAEVSWPSSLDYEDRNRMSFSLEVAAP